MSTHPVFKYASLDSPVVYHQNRVISLGELLQTVDYLAAKVPAHQYLLNLYEERYYFLLGFLLGLKQQTISLFPSTVTTHVLTQLNDNYDDLLLLSDLKPEHEQSYEEFQVFDLKGLLEETDFHHALASQSLSDKKLWAIIPEIQLSRNIAIIFTSGSTGQPKPYIKQWNDLLISTRHLTQCLFSDKSTHDGVDTHTNKSTGKKSISALLATVPAQHMYGLEASIIVALQNGFLIHSRKPFFPQDITQSLEELIQFAHSCGQTIETTVITTPLHLKACLKTEVPLPGIKQFFSATAPLPTELAQLCETQYSVPVLEIFGCTEVGSIACRRTTETEQWTVLNDITLEALSSSHGNINEQFNSSNLNKNDETAQNDIRINTSRSIKHFLFNDIIELLDERHFILKGRKEDLINLAGKRTSLNYLNHHLQSCEELTDACFYQEPLTENRLVAFVVLKQPTDMSNKQMSLKIRSYLKPLIESIFLPKKIYFVDTLPRNATGKLPQSELKKLMPQQVKK